MAFKFDYVDGGAGVEITLSGAVDGAECIQANDKLYGDERNQRLRFQIWDFTAIEAFDVTPEQLHTLLRQDKVAAQTNAGQRIAFVAPRSLIRRFAMSYDSFSRWISAPFDARAFESWQDARQWVDESMDEGGQRR